MNILEKTGLALILVSQICLGARFYSEATLEFQPLTLINPLLSIYH